jgi:EmrB/QacA subfamily drug resistance transporter
MNPPSSPPSPTADPHAPPQRWLGLLGVGMGVFMFTLDGSIVNVALPTFVHVFGTTFATVQWVVLGYLLVVTALVMGAARLGDLFGKKRLYLVGLGIFTASSLLCALSPSAGWLIAFRVVQGLGAVFVSALGAAIVAQIFPPHERGRALGFVGTAVLLGVSLGPSVGGLLIDFAGWRWMFLVNIPVGIVTIAVVARFVPALAGVPSRGRFDGAGTLLFAAALSSFALALTWGQRDGFSTTLVLSLFALAAVTLIAFLYTENKVAAPLLDLHMFRNAPFASGLLMGNLVFIVIGGTGFLMPFYLETVAHFSPAKVGLLLAIAPVVGGTVAPFGGALADRIGPRRVLLAGLLLLGGGCFLLATLPEQVTVWGFALRVVPVGIGLGMFNAANNSSVLNAVPREQLGVASGLLSLMRTLGQTTGVPLIAALFGVVALSHANHGAHEALLTLPASSLVHGMRWAFVAAGLLALAGAAVCVWLLRTGEDVPAPPAAEPAAGRRGT